MKTDHLAAKSKLGENDERRGERGVAAQIDLDRGRHPAQLELPSARNHERRLGEIVFARDVLECVVRQPAFEKTDARRISAEDAVCEGIDLIVGEAHGGLKRWCALQGSNL